jgi:hypothetical protein
MTLGLVWGLLDHGWMEPVPAVGVTGSSEKRDLFFECQHCRIPLVVDAAAAGMTLQCQSCGKPAVVPGSQPDHTEVESGSACERLAELERHLKENESQRTEIKGYINQLSIQLHRWQLRLQTLENRRSELTTRIASLRTGTV